MATFSVNLSALPLNLIAPWLIKMYWKGKLFDIVFGPYYWLLHFFYSIRVKQVNQKPSQKTLLCTTTEHENKAIFASSV